MINFIKKAVLAIKLMSIYLYANILLRTVYDSCYTKGGRMFVGGKYGAFTAPGWTVVVNDYLSCRRLKVNSDVPWPVSASIRVVGSKNIVFHPDDLNNFQGIGNYYQGIGRITIGKGTYIAPNVGIITANHIVDNLDEHDPPKPVALGEQCWIGMNSIILPGVTLGSHTIVGAGSVVTKSFPEGNCIIIGNPARIKRMIENQNSNKEVTLNETNYFR